MKETLSLIWLWTRIVVLSLVGLYALLVFALNFRAHIEPGLTLPLIVAFERPNAVAALLLVSILSIGLFYLLLQLYRTTGELKAVSEKRRLIKAERELADIRGKADPFSRAEPASITPAANDRESGPIPLADEGGKAPAASDRPRDVP